jgi:hypothetical protein
MPLQPHQIADLVELTLRKFIKNKWIDISLDLQEYIAMSHLLTDKKVGFDGGEQLQWQVKVSNSGNARNTALFDEDETSVGDHAKSAVLPWTFQTTNWAYDDREDAFQSSMERIVSLIKMREHAAMTDLALLMETNFFEKPSDPTTPAEKLKPYGLKYWFVRNAVEGFTGSLPAGGFTNVAGLSPTTYEGWRNWSAAYDQANKIDLIRKMRKASRYTKFMPPVKFPDAGGSPRWMYLLNYATLAPLEEALEGQNSTLGNDLASKDGEVLFKRTPMKWAPYLDGDPQNPVYGINWGKFRAVFKTGEYMKKHKPKESAESHRTWVVHTDNSCQFQCLDRRQGGFVLFQNV